MPTLSNSEFDLMPKNPFQTDLNDFLLQEHYEAKYPIGFGEGMYDDEQDLCLRWPRS